MSGGNDRPHITRRPGHQIPFAAQSSRIASAATRCRRRGGRSLTFDPPWLAGLNGRNSLAHVPIPPAASRPDSIGIPIPSESRRPTLHPIPRKTQTQSPPASRRVTRTANLASRACSSIPPMQASPTEGVGTTCFARSRGAGKLPAAGGGDCSGGWAMIVRRLRLSMREAQIIRYIVTEQSPQTPLFENCE